MKTMKKMRAHLVLALVVLFASSSFETRAQQVSVSFQVFYNELQPYGSWFNHPDYGYVWAPDVPNDFTPYSTNGYWTVTQYGNTWVSNYAWGWAPFHYGRWYFDDFYGWIWVPDTVWAPAWVVWRNGGGYYGWAPMGPGLNFSLSFNIFNRIPNFYWTFCPQQYVWSTGWYGYCAPRTRNVYIINNTTYVEHYYVNNSHHYYSGPSHREIGRVTHNQVHVRQMEDCNTPNQHRVDHDKVVLYRPIVSRDGNDRPTQERIPRGNGYGWNNNPRGNNNGGNNGNGGSANGNGGNNSGEGNGGHDHPRGGGNGNNADDNNNNGGPRGNNGHGNGDQDAPGNSGGHNNAENSDNSGNGNSGNGKGGHNSERMSSSFSRTFPNEREIERPSGNRSSSWNNSRSNGIEQRSSNSQSGGNSSRTIERSNSNRSNSSMSFPNRSNTRSSSPNISPSRSSGSRSNSSMSIPRSSGSRSNTMSSPGRSGGSRSISTPSRSGGSHNSIPRKKN